MEIRYIWIYCCYSYDDGLHVFTFLKCIYILYNYIWLFACSFTRFQASVVRFALFLVTRYSYAPRPVDFEKSVESETEACADEIEIHRHRSTGTHSMRVTEQRIHSNKYFCVQPYQMRIYVMTETMTVNLKFYYIFPHITLSKYYSIMASMGNWANYVSDFSGISVYVCVVCVVYSLIIFMTAEFHMAFYFATECASFCDPHSICNFRATDLWFCNLCTLYP